MADLKYMNYYNENAYEDTDHLLTICDTAANQIYQKFKLDFRQKPELLASVFGKIFETFLKKLEELESNNYSDYEINVCNRLLIGFTTNANDDDEKAGNFMIYIRHLNSNKKNEEVDDFDMKASERAVQWNTENITTQTEIIKQISIAAIKNLETIEVQLQNSECIMPIFILVYEAIVNYLKIARREADQFEFEINFFSCFFIGARESEDGIDDIYIRPNIDSKLRLKNDAKATAPLE